MNSQNVNGANKNNGFDPSKSLLPAQAQGASGLEGASSVMGSDGLPMGMMTCEQLLAWLQTKLMGMNKRVMEKMDISNRNSDAQDKLNQVARELSNCRNGEGDAETAAAAIRTALQTHGKDDTIPKALKDKLNEMLASLEAKIKADKYLASPEGMNAGLGDPVKASAIFAAAVRETLYDDVGNAITNQNSALEKLGSMGLTELNMLVSQMNQATGLVSGMMSSFNDSAKGVISNMRG
ncbi:MAG: hypothetical protein HY898_22325 [Deltaproteobacteria bacterium]|nr:hypothetical protein [Deltaproteobacteria bacterium]